MGNSWDYPKTFREIPHTFRATVQPAYWPVTLTDAKEQLDFGTTTAADDRKIEGLIPVAVGMVESDCQRAIANQTWELVMDEFPSDWHDEYEIQLRMPPIQAVSSITYTDLNGTTQTLSSSLYDTDTKGEPGRIWPAYASTGWPDTRCKPNAVTVTFTAGYVDTPVPAVAIKAILLALKALYYDCAPGEAYHRMVDRLKWEGGL